MLSITTSPSFTTATKRFKKFGKKMKKQNDANVSKIREKLTDISRDEQRRVKEIFREHQEFFKGSPKKEDGVIDFFENWIQTINYIGYMRMQSVYHETDMPRDHLT